MKVQVAAVVVVPILLLASLAPFSAASSEQLRSKTNQQQQRRMLKDYETKEAQDDEITVLPGWDDPLPSRMFSGHVDAGTKKDGDTTHTLHEHYFFVESEGDPMKDPVVIW